MPLIGECVPPLELIGPSSQHVFETAKRRRTDHRPCTRQNETPLASQSCSSPILCPVTDQTCADRGTDDDCDGNVLAEGVEQLNGALRAIAPSGVIVGSRRIDPADVRRLLPAEATSIAQAVVVRRNEFASGRSLLRELIGQNGPILVAPNRAPVLPAGVLGSLAHDREYAVAAISRDAGVIGLGIDIEPMTLLSPEMATVILRNDERDVDSHPHSL